MTPAVIYCRVSSAKQVKEGHGLTSQEATCRQYAATEGFQIVRVFTDDTSGGGDFWNRPGIRQLLEFLEEQKTDHAVIFDDLKRFARDTEFHLKLRRELAARGATPRCPTFRFEDTPEGQFVETVIAATAELERKQNRRQVIRRMKARLEAGHWIFCPPLGYRSEKKGGQKRTVPDPILSPHIKQALQSFASSTLPTQASVEKFLRAYQSQRKSLSIRSIPRFLSNPFYAGRCVCEKWGIDVPGKHQPLITPETHKRILQRLTPTLTTFTRSRNRPEFPLRRYIHCSTCRKPLTGCWTQGRNQKYPYYRCPTKACSGSIPTATVEAHFLHRLKEATPRPSTVKLFEAILREAFSDRQSMRNASQETSANRIKEINRETENLLDALSHTKEPRIRTLYEQRITSLQDEKEQLETKQHQKPEFTIEPVLDKGRELLSNPHQYWRNGDLRRRLTVQKLAFEQPIWYDRNSGFYTAEFSLVYGLLKESEEGDGSLVDLLHANLHPVAEELKRWELILSTFPEA